MNEPLRGYIDSWTAISRYVSIIGRGLKRSMYADKKVAMDLIPADMVHSTHSNNFLLKFHLINLGYKYDTCSSMEYCDK